MTPDIDKKARLIETLKRAGLAANDDDAERIARRMLTLRDIEPE